MYQQVNIGAFNLLALCLSEQYNAASTSAQNVKLIQPLEQAAKIARALGQYPIERELLYKRKKLELRISEKEIWQGLFWEYNILLISDGIYGFGYKRLKALRFFVICLCLGVIISWHELSKKQIKYIENSVNFRNQELIDEKLEDFLDKDKMGDECAGQISFKELLPYIDSIKRVVFQGRILENDARQSLVYVTFKDKNLLKKLKDSGKFSIDLSTNKDCLQKDYLRVFFGKTGTNINRGLRLNTIPLTWLLLRQYSCMAGILCLCKSHNIEKKKGNDRQVITFTICLIIKDGLYKFASLFLKDNQKDIKDIKYLLQSLSFRTPINSKIGFCENLFPNSGLWLVYEDQRMKNQNKKFLKYQLYYLDGNEHFSNCATRLLKQKRIVTSFIYSLDLLLPIIELEPEIYNFIFHDSKSWTKLYFISQKIIAAIIATILLPILFISGL